MKRVTFLPCLLAMRPWSFTASAIPAVLGTVLAYKQVGTFSPDRFLATLLIVLCVHAAGNLVNTFWDFVKGVDDKDSDDCTLVNKILPPELIVYLFSVCYVIAAAGFLYLMFQQSEFAASSMLFLFALASSYCYSGGVGLKYIAAGDFIILLSFGLAITAFSFLSQTQVLSLAPFLYNIPIALNIEAILHSNNARDVESDRRAGILTLPILLGDRQSYWLFNVLLFGPYLMFVSVAVCWSVWMFLPVCSITVAVSLHNSYRKGDLKQMPQKVAQLNLMMGLLYILAVSFTRKESLPFIK